MSDATSVRRSVCWIVVTVLLAIFTPLKTRGQAASTGTISGQIMDSSNAAVVGATVGLTDTATNTERSTATNDSGRYLFVDVSPGSYILTVSKTGFRSSKVTGLEIKVGVALTSNVVLQLGPVAQTVEVTANMGGELQTTNATVGNTITGVSLDSLPSLGRDVSSFVTLQPGVTPDGSVAGAVYDQTTFQLDGGNNSNDMDGSMNIYTPSFAGDPSGGLVSFYVQGGPGSGGGPTGVMPTPTDSIEEFKVSTNNQTADFNGSAGAEVSMVTKRGGAAWHGTAYEYYLDDNWNANLWDNNATGTPIPSFHYNRYGGAVGGPIVPKSIWGGKTYFFANYQGFRWPNSETIERTVPSDAMRLGLLQFAGNVYNLNPVPVTFSGTTYPADNGTLDPRMLGISPSVQQLWSKLPEPNDTQCSQTLCDNVNVMGFKGNMAIPQHDNFGVARLDHDFGDKWHFMSSYRYYHLVRATDSQFDISSGTPTSLSSRPQVPWYFVAGLTTNITSNFTNDFHYSFLRNFWQWGSFQDPPQFSGLGGALEPFGEDRINSLVPYNVNTQNTRTRFWDGHDNMIRDDLSLLNGNHLFQFGGTYQHNWDYHQRSDNGGGINYEPVYQLGTVSGSGINIGNIPAAVSAAGDAPAYGRDYAAVLGIVSVAQTAYTRTGANLTLNPPLTPAYDQSTIPYYNVYFSDSWHMKPSFTLTYGLGWALEMPPVEKNGKQILLVDQSDEPIDLETYIKARENAALQGQVYNPIIGYALVGNTQGGRKYPYDPFYGSFSPRIAAAWNPHFDDDTMLGKILGPGTTVIRGGYSRIYGRLNGVDLVLVPLLGTGLIQPVQCTNVLSNGSCGSASPTPSTAFRVGPTSGGWDGLVAPLPAPSPTLPQPDFPGVNAVAAGAGSVLDPHFRPNSSDQFDFTIQRQLSRRAMLEVGYIGRLIHDEYQPVNLNAVPYMMTLNGQSFAKAYAAIETGLGCATSNRACGANIPTSGGQAALTAYASSFTPQPFFDPPGGGTATLNAAYCAGYSSCTAAVVGHELQTNNLQTQSVWNMWSDLDNGNFTFPRTMMNTPLNCPTGAEIGCGGQTASGVADNASIGHANYNALFASMRMSDWHGLTLQSNFTYGKALGTGATAQATSGFTLADPYNLDRNYGLQTWDRKFVYNLFFVYQPPYYKGQHGVIGHVLGGWTFAPVFSAGSGLPLEVNTANESGQSYGEGDSLNYFGGEFTAFGPCGCGPGENAMLTKPYTGGNSRHNNVPGSNGIGTGGFGVNMFADPASVFLDDFRPAILGLDTGRTGAGGVLRGLPYWNVDLSVSKVVNVTERVNLQFTSIFTNVFNHPQFGDPYMALNDPSAWGVLPGQWNTPRQIELGFRVRF